MVRQPIYLMSEEPSALEGVSQRMTYATSSVAAPPAKADFAGGAIYYYPTLLKVDLIWVKEKVTR